jgi:hypothetical protein
VTQGDDPSAPFLLRKRRLVQFAVTGPRSPRVRAMIPSNAVRNRIPSITNRLGFALAVGASVRHVGNRFNFQDNLVVMDAYNVADAYVFVDIPKWALSAVDNTRFAPKL